jgi:hypothetical protein
MYIGDSYIGSIEIVAIIGAFFLINILGPFIKRKNQNTVLLLKDFDINNDHSNGYFLRINGLESGFMPWLLDKLKLKNRNFEIQFKKDQIETITGDKNFEKFPSRDVYSIFVGYGDRKIYLLASILLGLMSLFSLFIFVDDNFEIDYIVPIIFNSALCYLFYWLYKRSSMMSILLKLHNLSIGVQLKSSLTGKKITLEDLVKIKEMLYEASNSSSRFYNQYYKK